MVKYKEIIFGLIIIFFLLFSFYPTIYEIASSNHLRDQNREFILEHNFYWPDYNLYLSKIRQGLEGRLTALERYTSEPHKGSLIQIFYVYLGQLGRIFQLSPNFSYQLGRIILSPLLLIIILLLVNFYFKEFYWQVFSLLVILTASSFPRFYTDASGAAHIGRFMEWWSNIDAVQRLTFIPHILFGQVASLYLLYQITINKQPTSSADGQLTKRKLLFFIILGNLTGLVFPPSLITLDGVIILTLIINTLKNNIIPNPKTKNFELLKTKPQISILQTVLMAISSNQVKSRYYDQEILNRHQPDGSEKFGIKDLSGNLLFIIFTLPSLLYLFFITRVPPWSSLVIFHQTHPMLIPFWEYILGTGPIFFLGALGAVIAVLRRDKKYQPLIFWVLLTFLFAILFTYIKEQSPLRFTQTGLFIPLGILTTYFFYQLFRLSHLSHFSNLGKSAVKTVVILFICLYLLLNLSMIKISLDWQTNFISQRVRANVPPVPYPPQTMYPLKSWMDAIRFLRDNTNHDDVVLAAVTAGNYIPAYSGNTVYFGQANTVDYERKQQEVVRFFSGKMKSDEASKFLNQGRITYIFDSIQEKELRQNKNLKEVYPFLKEFYNNDLVEIFIRG